MLCEYLVGDEGVIRLETREVVGEGRAGAPTEVGNRETQQGIGGGLWMEEKWA